LPADIGSCSSSSKSDAILIPVNMKAASDPNPQDLLETRECQAHQGNSPVERVPPRIAQACGRVHAQGVSS
jgi:hypothetical protein